MKLKNLSLVYLMMLILTACGPSYSSINEKIENNELEEINENEKDQEAILNYLSEVMDFIDKNQDMPPASLPKEIREKFPYAYNFLRYYGMSGLSDYAEQEWDRFLQDQISKGRDKLYAVNPIYDVMVNADRDITEREIPLIVEYVYQGMNTSDNSNFRFIKIISNRARLESYYPNLSRAYNEGMRKYYNN